MIFSYTLLLFVVYFIIPKSWKSITWTPSPQQTERRSADCFDEHHMSAATRPTRGRTTRPGPSQGSSVPAPGKEIHKKEPVFK